MEMEKPSENLTAAEDHYRTRVVEKLNELFQYLASTKISLEQPPSDWYRHLNTIKQIQGNLNNDVSFIATLLAKLYIESKYGAIDFDAARKPQGAPGLDVDIKLPNGDRLVGEIKTTTPYNGPDFGAQQKASFETDFAKLSQAVAEHKYMFVTEESAFQILCKPKYAAKLAGVQIVQLVSGSEFAA